MHTATYPRPCPGCPRLSMPRRRGSLHPVRLNDGQYTLLAEEIASRLRSRTDIDDIIFGVRYYSFHADTRETKRTVHTGIEHLGQRETTTKTEIHLLRLRLEGIYSIDGKALPHDIDCRRIEQILKKETLILEE